MSFTDQPSKPTFPRLGPISPEIDVIVDMMYREMDDPEHQGNLVDALEIIQELMGEHDTRSEFFEQNPPLEETEPDPLLFPEDSGFEDAVLATPEAPVTGMSKSFDRSAYLESMKRSGSIVSLKLAQSPSFLAILDRVDSFLAKPIDSDVATVTGEPKKGPRWVRRRLEPAKRLVDLKPNRLGPTGTWVNDSEAEERDGTQTVVQTRGTVTSLRRQDTLTD